MSDIELPAEPETPNPGVRMPPGEKLRQEAHEAVNKIRREVPRPELDVIATPSELERRRQSEKLRDAYCQLDLRFFDLDDESPTRAAFYTNIRLCFESVYELGKHAAPEGEKAREANSERARRDAQTLVTVIEQYCSMNHKEPRASEKFANIILPDIQAICGSKVTKNEVFTALRRIRKGSYEL